MNNSLPAHTESQAVVLLRAIVRAIDQDTARTGGYYIPGDSALGVVLALAVDPYLAELDGDPYFAISGGSDA